ncbi:hypothetical protein JOF42_002498 [Microbacterium phyllosphaerae]|uniref:Uncharacterized protein n=1 Tax=Microbacterium phyllosphaerae TaxID=124798 RepID=A0ABS4WS06_9MICO|nr:hypothetical protein [Microbacterium phyllosphaerae]MBP2379003.1 hypothetical protein [Microbacterium phyllosphaerae]
MNRNPRAKGRGIWRPRRARADRGAHVADRLDTTAIVIDGDAHDLVRDLQVSALQEGVLLQTFDTATEPAQIVILAIEGDGRSSLLKINTLLRSAPETVTPDALRIAVIRSGRARIAPAKLQRLLASEILFQITVALAPVTAGARDRSIRQRLVLGSLDAAGFNVLRVG